MRSWRATGRCCAPPLPSTGEDAHSAVCASTSLCSQCACFHACWSWLSGACISRPLWLEGTCLARLQQLSCAYPYRMFA